MSNIAPVLKQSEKNGNKIPEAIFIVRKKNIAGIETSPQMGIFSQKYFLETFEIVDLNRKMFQPSARNTDSNLWEMDSMKLTSNFLSRETDFWS